MMNSPYRTALTRDEAVGNLIGLLKGPYYIIENENVDNHSHLEEDYLDYDEIYYDVFNEIEETHDDLVDIYYNAKDSNENESILSRHQEAIKELKTKRSIAIRVSQYFDDEISKGSQSTIRRDINLSNENVPLYTTVSIMEWAKNKFNTKNLADLSTPINLNITGQDIASEEGNTIKYANTQRENHRKGLHSALVTIYILSNLLLEKHSEPLPFPSRSALAKFVERKVDSHFPEVDEDNGFGESSITKRITKGKENLESMQGFQART